MTAWTVTHFPAVASRRDADRSVNLPKPHPFCAPVHISDCVTPLGGETVLSLLMKRMMQDDTKGSGAT